MEGCSTGILDERQRSDSGYNMGPLKVDFSLSLTCYSIQVKKIYIDA